MKRRRYMAGFYEHYMVSAMWSIDESGLLSAYSKELSLLGTDCRRLDSHGADHHFGYRNLWSQYLSHAVKCEGWKSVNLGSPLKLIHKNGSTMDDYDAQLKQPYAKYQLAIGKLTELLSAYCQSGELHDRGNGEACHT
ncbi:MAG: hypothetical protein ACLVGL_14265 [Waltera sp.]